MKYNNNNNNNNNNNKVCSLPEADVLLTLGPFCPESSLDSRAPKIPRDLSENTSAYYKSKQETILTMSLKYMTTEKSWSNKTNSAEIKCL